MSRTLSPVKKIVGKIERIEDMPFNAYNLMYQQSIICSIVYESETNNPEASNNGIQLLTKHRFALTIFEID